MTIVVKMTNIPVKMTKFLHVYWYIGHFYYCGHLNYFFVFVNVEKENRDPSSTRDSSERAYLNLYISREPIYLIL